MATRSLGTLTLDLIAKIGGFEEGMDRASRTADKKTREIERNARARAKEIEKAFDGIGAAIAGGFAGITIGTVFAKFITETKEAEQEQAQLAAVVKSTGMAAGYSVGQLNDMAAALAQSSVFSEGDINKAQTRLLSYTGVVGDQVPKAMQAVIDMSSRLGVDLNQAAETIGKALDVPSEGLSALSKQGFRFTDDQKKVVEQLERTGKTAQAQKIILDALESSYGGAAAAARDTFGGALAALQNNIDDLLTGDSGSMVELKNSVETLNSTLSSDATKSAFAAFTKLLTDVSVKAVQALTDVGNFMSSGAKLNIMGNFALSEFGVGGRQTGDNLAGSNIKALTTDIAAMEAEVKKATDRGDKARVEQMQKSISESLRSREYFKQLQAQQAMNLVDGYPDEAARRRVGLPVAGDGVGVKPKATTGKDKAAKETDFQKTMERLRKELDKTKELTEYEQLLSDIRAGRIKNLLPGEQLQLENAAKALDLGKANAKVVAETKKMEEEMQKFLGEMSADQTKRAREQVDTLAQQNKQMREEVELIAVSAEGRAAIEKARLSSAIATKEETLALREKYGATKSEQEALRAEIALLYERADILTDKGVKEALAEDQKFYEQMQQNIQDSLGQGLYDILDGNFKNIGKSFANTLKKMAADALAADLARAMFGAKGTTGGGLFGTLLGAGSMALGDATGTSIGGTYGNATQASLTTLFASVSGKASGGDVAAGSLHRINELGPEVLDYDGKQFLMMGRKGGSVIPAVAAGAATNSPGGMVINNNAPVQLTSATMRRTSRGTELTLEGLEAQYADPNSRISKAQQRAWNMERKR